MVSLFCHERRTLPAVSDPVACSVPRLRDWLAAQGGAVSFRGFMEAALYDPEFGYYSRQIRTVGPGGDFSTSATLSPRLGRALAAWVKETAQGEFRHLIEIGPGNGILHRTLRQAMGWRGRWHWHSHLVERSPVLRKEQQKTLGREGRWLQWHASPEEALTAAGGKALIFSNELVDAFPATLLQRHDGLWQEVWLELAENGAVVETLRPAPEIDTTLDAAHFSEGQRVEVHVSWRQWLAAWRPQWRQGAMMTIDYGGSADRLYHRRPHGSLRGFFHHQRLHGLAIYRNPGHCDLTADVNFSDLSHWGAAMGLTTVRLETQTEFLARIPACGDEAGARLADPDGAGGAFYCLHQHAEPFPPGAGEVNFVSGRDSLTA